MDSEIDSNNPMYTCMYGLVDECLTHALDTCMSAITNSYKTNEFYCLMLYKNLCSHNIHLQIFISSTLDFLYTSKIE